MFTGVCLSTGGCLLQGGCLVQGDCSGGGGCLLWRGAWCRGPAPWGGGCLLQGGCLVQGACSGGGGWWCLLRRGAWCRGACSVGGAYSRGVPAPRGVPGGNPPGWLLLQVVRILLEYFLLIYLCELCGE